MSALERSESPRAVNMIVRGLEFVTGRKSTDIVGFSASDVDWYRQNGYNQLSSALAGYQNFSNQRVTVDSSLESSAFFGAVKILCEDMGALPFFLFKRDTADRRNERKATEHPLYSILHDLPNPDLNASQFVETMMAGAILCREGYAKIERQRGQVTALWPFTPGSVRREYNKAGRPFYIYKDGNRQEITYGASEIFNLPGLTLDGKSGDDLIQRARHVLGLTLAAQEYPARFFANDASPGVILTRPANTGAEWDLARIAAIKERWKAWHQGTSRAHEPAVLQDGVTATRLDPDHGKLQLVEQRKFQVIEICRLLRMPPHKIAELDRSTNNNIEHQGIEYETATISPWVVRWRQSVNRCLLTPAERAAGYYAEHNTEALRRGDFKGQAEAWARLQEKGDITQNEVRQWLHLPPVPDGDKLYVQLNMGAVAEIGKHIEDNRGQQDSAAPPKEGL